MKKKNTGSQEVWEAKYQLKFLKAQVQNFSKCPFYSTLVIISTVTSPTLLGIKVGIRGMPIRLIKPDKKVAYRFSLSI